jgi:hypothetical protein
MPFRSKAGAQRSLSPYRCPLLGGDDTNQPQIPEVVCSILYAKMNIGDGQTRESVCSAHRRRIAHRGSSLTIVLTSRPQGVGGPHLRLDDVSQHIRERPINSFTPAFSRSGVSSWSRSMALSSSNI